MPEARFTPVQAAEYLGISVQAVYVLNSRPRNGFPEPEHIGRTPTWLPSELDSWRAEHPAKRPRQQPGRRAEEGRRSPSTTAHDLRVHVAFATRQRQAVLTADALRLVEGAMREAAQRSRADITDFAGHPDHVRAVLRYPADLAASDLVRRLKSASARALREEGSSRVWAPSFFLASIGAGSAAGIDEYVREQEQVINS